jgi:LacI family transcriptional regulator
MYSKDIAKLAGVSRSTVSRVVNNYSNVSVEAKEKVTKIIEKYGYVPHGPARTLAGKHNTIIGVFITNVNLGNEKFSVFHNAYYSPFTAAIIDCADELGYNALVSITNNNSDFKKIRDLFYNRTLSGGIFIGAYNDLQEIYNLIESGYKLVIIDQDQEHRTKVKENYIIVNSNNIEGARTATRHLIEYGHSEIAHICGDTKKLSGTKRLDGYKKEMNEAGLIVRKDYIVDGDFTENSGYECAKKLLTGKKKNNITGIFSSNDSMAIGAMKAIMEMGLKIPDDISIVGYDDIRIASYTSPSLTTIKSSILEMASIATKNLVNFIENGITFTECHTISTELVIRESTKKLKV